MQIEHCDRSTSASRLGRAIDVALRCAEDPEEALTRLLPGATVAAGASGATLWMRQPGGHGFQPLETVGAPATADDTGHRSYTVELGAPGHVLAVFEFHGISCTAIPTTQTDLADELRRLHHLAAAADAHRRLRHVQSSTAEALHDLVDILTLISGAADAILTGDEAPRAAVEQIHACVEHAARIAVGHRTPPGGPADLTSAGADLRRLLEPTFGPEATLTVTVDPQLPPAAIDPGQLLQVLVNLVLNARDALAGNGTVTVTAAQSTEANPTGQDQIRLTVQDDGGGIPRAELAHIFKPFFTTKEHGTGLGLAAVRRIVTAHGGTIGVQSSPEGTRFTLTLPSHTEPLRPDLRAATP